MPKKKKRTANKSNKKVQKKSTNPLYYINISLTILIVMIAVFLGIYIIKDEPKHSTPHKKPQKKQEILYEEYTDAFNETYYNTIEDINKSELEDISKYLENEKERLEHNKTLPLPKTKKSVDKSISSSQSHDKPKLAIVIDDITYQSQINRILSLGYSVNMSFLPPTSRHKNSAKVAQPLSNYMIHLPLQASSFFKEEENTLHVTHDYETIENRIKTLKEMYPKAVYINNHTGSKFTSNDRSMDMLLQAIRKYNLKFLDSRTTADSVAQKYAHKHNVPFLTRNIFLDNKKDFHYIQGQLKKAIKIAKKTGMAIAIGHPHGVTMDVLKASKPLLSELELVYIEELEN